MMREAAHWTTAEGAPAFDHLRAQFPDTTVPVTDVTAR
jgi:hypothetical protein